MKKYLVDVYLPTIGQHYDAYLPSERRIYEAMKLLADIAESLGSGTFRSRDISMLMDAETGEPFDPGITVREAGIRNSSHLILI